jgi:hypothetical protein
VRNLIPSPLRSVPAFVGYLLIFIAPLWALIAFLGSVDFVVSYADFIVGALHSWWGILLLIVTGFALLAWDNYKRLAASDGKEASARSADAEDVGQLRTQLDDAKQEIDRLRIELDDRPPRHFNTPVEVVETLTPATAKEIEQLKSENQRLRNQVASPEVAKQKRLCLYLAEDLRALYESFEQDERVLIGQLQKRKPAGADMEELEEERRAKQAEIEERVVSKYHHGYWDRLEKLYEDLEPDGWLGPNDESLFLSVNAPHEIVLVADRLAELGHKL